MKHQARKRFGQNFLHDQGVIDRIIHGINPRENETIVEIGPGQGALTGPLLRRAKRISVIELDRDLIPGLYQLPREGEHLEIHECDVLNFDFGNIANPPIRVIGNLPYNISTPIIFHLLEHKALIKDMYFMLQREVVERIIATPNSKDYGRLSIMLQYHCKADMMFQVLPGSFSPPPKVTSAIVRILPYQDALPHPTCVDLTILDEVVKAAFSKRRKTISNAVKELIDSEGLSRLNIKATLRPENLTITDFVNMANEISRQRSKC